MIDAKLDKQITVQLHEIQQGLIHDMLQEKIENDGGLPPFVLGDAEFMKRRWMNWVMRN